MIRLRGFRRIVSACMIGLVSALIWLSYPPAAAASDMRATHQISEEKKERLLEKARAEEAAAKEMADERTRKIINDKIALKKAIAELKGEIGRLSEENETIQIRIGELQNEEAALRKDLEATAVVNREFQGVVQAHAKDLSALFRQSIQSGLEPGRHGFLEPVIQGRRFPSMEDVGEMADHLFSEIRASGQVIITTGPMVDRKGKEESAQLLLLGNFTGIYTLGNETGFLLYSDTSQRYFALSKLPSARITDNISAYLAGKSDAVYMDISKGGAIRQLAHQLSLAEQVPKGGAIVWPILVILGLAVLILVERSIFFIRRRTNAEALMAVLREKIQADDWDGSRKFLESRKQQLIPGVLLTALAFKDQTRQDMENALQEAILGEIPRVERFLSTLGMLAAIAPLLGLLGTVTGMINTFHVMTYHGTGDPRMMSGGISEALVTTMLGLSVAIPIMLAHTLLSRRVETQIARMEEKSVAFVNIVFKNRNECRAG